MDSERDVECAGCVHLGLHCERHIARGMHIAKSRSKIAKRRN